MKALNIAMVIALLLGPLVSSAAQRKKVDPYQPYEPSEVSGPRSRHWSGFDFALGMPFPSLAGALLGFNIEDDARLSAGVGTFGNYVTYQLDAKVFLSPSNWAMYVGAGMDYLNGNPGVTLAWDLQFHRAFVPYFETGLDFQSEVGVHVTFNLGASAPNGRFIILPGIAIGWYF